MRIGIATLLVAVSLTACAAKPPKSMGASTGDAGAPPPRVVTPVDSGVAAPAPIALAWAPAAPPVPERAGAMTTEDVTAWYAARGTRLPSDFVAPVCHAIKVGLASEDALFCRVTTQQSAPGRVQVSPAIVEHLVVRAVRKKRVVTLFDQPFDVIDPSSDKEARTSLFAVAVDVSSRSEITVQETGPGACTEAKTTLHDALDAAKKNDDASTRTGAIAEAKLHEKIRAEICAGVGRYTWTKDRFAKAR